MSKVPAENSNIIRSDESYRGLLNELRSILDKGQNRAYKAVDNIKVQTYWQIGERIVREEIKNKERAEYDLGFAGSYYVPMQVLKKCSMLLADLKKRFSLQHTNLNFQVLSS